ncbi:MAG: MarR family transcriptional regulator [Nitrosomonadales bacterium]|nr:MarR family transcriptional regulator [Nitrosomonadales bacterium]|tara:strand:- start:21 stop:491 length:471 start_codon:yes stop_codon:yes gene_type:complete
MTKFNNLLLNNQLCFALYAATNSVIRYYRIYLNEIGITYTQYLVLLVLWEQESTNVNKIAKTLQLDSPTVTPIIQKLEKMNLVKRERSKSDERIVIVSLTKNGIDLEHQVAAIQDKVACKTQLNTKDFDELKETLNNLTKTMSEKEQDKENLLSQK